MNRRLDFLDSIRFLSITFVILGHSVYYAPGLDSHIYNFIYIACAWSVPIFFLVDGFLFCNSKHKTEDYIKNSFRRLIIPWFVFSFLYATIRIALEYQGVFKETYFVGKSWDDILFSIYGNQYAHQLYFLQSLFIIRCLVPIWKRLQEVDISTLIVIILGYWIIYTLLDEFAITDLPNVDDPIHPALMGIQFFLIGMLFHKTGKIGIDGLLLLAVMTPIICHINDNLNVQRLLAVSTIFAIFSYFQIGILHSLGKRTMEIYILHAPILLACLANLLPPLIPSFRLLLMLVISIVISIGFAEVMKKMKIGKFMFGIKA